MVHFTFTCISSLSQKIIIGIFQDVAGNHPEIFDLVVKIIHWLYEQEILSENSIVNWFNNPSPEPDLDNAKRVRNKVM